MISLDNAYDHDIDKWGECFKKNVRQSCGTINSKRIFVAECDHELLALWSHVLEHVGYEVIACHAIKNILPAIHWMFAQKTDQSLVDLVICDVTLLSDVAIEKIAQKQRIHRFPPLILIAESTNSEMLSRAAELKRNATFDKTFDPLRQLGVVRQLAPIL